MKKQETGNTGIYLNSQIKQERGLDRVIKNPKSYILVII